MVVMRRTPLAHMFGTVQNILEAAGGTPANILKMTIWLRDASNREALNNEWVKMLPDPEGRPARHTLPLTGGGDSLVQCDVNAIF